MEIRDKFYEMGLDCLKIKKCIESNRFCILKISKPCDSHMTFGTLSTVGSQLFHIFLPELDKGQFLEMRQDTKDNNRIDLEIVVPDEELERCEKIKPREIHHQHNNDNENFYYITTSYEEWKIEVGISEKGYDYLLEKFYSQESLD